VLVTAGVVFTDWSAVLQPAHRSGTHHRHRPNQSVHRRARVRAAGHGRGAAAITSILAGRGITQRRCPPRIRRSGPTHQRVTTPDAGIAVGQAFSSLEPGNVVLLTGHVVLTGWRAPSRIWCDVHWSAVVGLDRLHAARRAGGRVGRTGPPHGAADRRRRRAS